jgi:hypothetical protein
MLRGGYSPIPLHFASKHPLVKKWQHLRDTSMSAESIAKLARERPQLGIAVAGGFNSLVPIDIDTDDPAVLAAYASAMPRPNVAKKGKRGLVCFYRAVGELPRGRDFMLPRSADGRPGKPLISILTTRKTVLPPSIHPDTQQPYRWLTRGTLYTKPVANLVPVTLDHIAALEVALRPWCPMAAKMHRPEAHPGEVVADRRMRAYALRALQNEAARLGEMGPDSGRNLRLFGAGCTLGKFVRHKVLALAEVESALLAACEANGLVRDDGETQCRQTLTNGIKKARGDGLPALRYWGRSTR